jgi:ABC-type multidrug transport system ATPase subunit
VAQKLSVRENLELIARIYGMDRGEAAKKAEQICGTLR